MNQYKAENIKSFALIGHQGCGKTSLLESLLYRSKNLEKKGSVEEGTTVSDFTKEEKQAQVSMYASVIPLEFEGFKFNFLDTPGFFDFEMETRNSLKIARNAIVVIDGSKGVEVGTRKTYKLARRRQIPMAIFVNKMDKDNIDLDKILDQLKNSFEKKAIPFTWPIGTAENHKGYLHLVDMTASINNEVVDIPAEYKELAEELHKNLIEAAANHDEAILEKFFMEEEITVEELKPALKLAVQKGSLIPVVFGSCKKDSGTKGLLGICKEYLASEIDDKELFGEKGEHKVEQGEKIFEDGPFSAYVFNTVVDPFVGKISFIKVVSGSISKDQTVLNTEKDVKERINNISMMKGKETVECSTITAGDIGVLMKVASLETGDTICDPSNPVQFKKVQTIEPTIYFGLEVKNKNDEGKITESLRKIASEDLSIVVSRNAESKQLLVGCQGQSHIDNVVAKLLNTYNIEVILSDAKISYRETIKGNSDVEGRYVKQSGGAGSYGVVKIKFSHSEQDFEFVNSVFGGSVPTNFIPCVEEGLKKSMDHGVLAGFPVIGVRAELYDGKSHPVDSKPLSFEMAASFAFKDGCKAAKPTLLEPIMEIKVVAPNEYIGDIMGDLSKRRGIIMGIDPEGEEQYITAEVPQSELGKYIIDLNTMTQAQATFTMKFIRYDEVPAMLVDKIVAENKSE